MTANKISPYVDVYHATNAQTNYSRLRDGFRCLLEAIKTGNTQDAQQAYDILTDIMKKVHQTFGAQLSKTYMTIGQALRAGDIHGARRAVIQLQRDLQHVAPTNQSSGDVQTLTDVHLYTPQGDIVNFYAARDRGTSMIGTHVDVLV